MKSNRSYGPETANLGFYLCNLDFWPLALNFCIDITSVIGLGVTPKNLMMIPWREHNEKGVTGTDRQTDADRKTETDRKTGSNFFKGKSIWKCYLQNVGNFFRPKYRLIWCLFFIKVYHQPKLNREIVHISKFQNKILYQSKKKELPHTFSTSSKRLQDRKWKSRLCSTIFVISYQTLAQCMCHQVHQFAVCTICIIYYTKYHTIQYWNRVEQKKIYSIKYFRNILWDIYMSIISLNKIYPYFA